MSLWPTIEWLATRTESADACVPRAEAEAILEELKRKEAVLKGLSLGITMELDYEKEARCSER